MKQKMMKKMMKKKGEGEPTHGVFPQSSFTSPPSLDFFHLLQTSFRQSSTVTAAKKCGEKNGSFFYRHHLTPSDLILPPFSCSLSFRLLYRNASVSTSG